MSEPSDGPRSADRLVKRMSEKYLVPSVCTANQLKVDIEEYAKRTDIHSILIIGAGPIV